MIIYKPFQFFLISFSFFVSSNVSLALFQHGNAFELCPLFFLSPREEEETEKVAFLLFKSVWKFWPAAMPPCFLRPSFPPLTTIPSSDSLCSWLLPLSTAPLCSSACVPASPPPPPPFHPLQTPLPYSLLSPCLSKGVPTKVDLIRLDGWARRDASASLPTNQRSGVVRCAPWPAQEGREKKEHRMFYAK